MNVKLPDGIIIKLKPTKTGIVLENGGEYHEGEWRMEREYYNDGKEYFVVRCSECREEVSNADITWNYCPYCGSKNLW